MASQWLGLRLLGLGLLLTLLVLTGELAFVLLYWDFALRMLSFFGFILDVVLVSKCVWLHQRCKTCGLSVGECCKVGRPVSFLLPNTKVNVLNRFLWQSSSLEGYFFKPNSRFSRNCFCISPKVIRILDTVILFVELTRWKVVPKVNANSLTTEFFNPAEYLICCPNWLMSCGLKPEVTEPRFHRHKLTIPNHSQASERWRHSSVSFTMIAKLWLITQSPSAQTQQQKIDGPCIEKLHEWNRRTGNRMACLGKCLSVDSSQWLYHNPAPSILELFFWLCWWWAWWSKHQSYVDAKLRCFPCGTVWQFQGTFGLGGVPLSSVLGQLAFIIFNAKSQQNEDDAYACHTWSSSVELFLYISFSMNLEASLWICYSFSSLAFTHSF